MTRERTLFSKHPYKIDQLLYNEFVVGINILKTTEMMFYRFCCLFGLRGLGVFLIFVLVGCGSGGDSPNSDVSFGGDDADAVSGVEDSVESDAERSDGTPQPDASETDEEETTEREDGEEERIGSGIEIVSHTHRNVVTGTEDITVEMEPGLEPFNIELRIEGEVVATAETNQTRYTFEDVELDAIDRDYTQVYFVEAFLLPEREDPYGDREVLIYDPRAQQTFRLHNEDTSQTPPRIKWGFHGEPAYIGQVSLPTEGSNPVEKALNFLDKWPKLTQLEQPRHSLAVSDIRHVNDQTTIVRFEQHHQGMPVVGSSVTVMIQGNSVVRLTGQYIPKIPTFAEPQVSQAEAEQQAKNTHTSSPVSVVGATRLVIYEPQWLGSEVYEENGPRLAWRVSTHSSVTSGDSQRLAYIDAVTGRELWSGLTRNKACKSEAQVCSKVVNAKNRPTHSKECMYDFVSPNSVACQSGLKGYSETCTSDLDDNGEAKKLIDFTSETATWLDDEFGWNLRKNGGRIDSVVDVPQVNAKARTGPCSNRFEFGDNYASRDLFLHEIGHRLLKETETDFTREWQSGALAEHYADLFAAFGTADQTGESNGFHTDIGGASPDGTFRNLSDPERKKFSDATRDHMDVIHGDIHKNSTIPTYAYFLLAEGKDFNGQTIEKVETDKLKQIMWETLVDPATHGGIRFTEYGLIVENAAQRLFDRQMACNVRNAFVAVEILDGVDSDCDGRLDWNDGDSDSVPDSKDNCEARFNPEQKKADSGFDGMACANDNDGDGTEDEHDNCEFVQNADQKDLNDNTIGAKCEDSDHDFRVNAEDNCIDIVNHAQTDLDGDGTGDPCDSDRDGDGVENSEDNCPDAENSGQEDWNSDGQGDVCSDSDGDGIKDHNDPCPGSLSSGDSDDDGTPDCETDDNDGDGVPDETDNCPFTANTNQKDLDNDGVGDRCDDDIDGDGIRNDNDTCRRDIGGARDTDEDGIPNCYDGDDDDDDVRDEEDLCPQMASFTTPADSDGDGVGDPCDNCPGTTNPMQDNFGPDEEGDACDSDHDLDGVKNENDACPRTHALTETNDEGNCEIDHTPQYWRDNNQTPSQVWLSSLNKKETDYFDQINRMNAIVPLSICEPSGACPDGYIPAGHTTELQLEGDIPFYAFVVDGEGNFVRRIEPGELETNGETWTGTLRFEPEQSAYYSKGADGRPSYRNPYQGQTYKLWASGAPGYGGADSKMLNIAVQ